MVWSLLDNKALGLANRLVGSPARWFDIPSAPESGAGIRPRRGSIQSSNASPGKSAASGAP